MRVLFVAPPPIPYKGKKMPALSESKSGKICLIATCSSTLFCETDAVLQTVSLIGERLTELAPTEGAP